jgi:gliding motility-associated-like protein
MLTLKNACSTLQHSFDVTEKFCDCNIYVPNAFTPDNNTINDKFLPVTDCIFSSYNLSIYNRWGVQVFSTDDITQGWDGKLKGKYCTQDVYYYTINAVADNGESFHIRKTFTLLRQ